MLSSFLHVAGSQLSAFRHLPYNRQSYISAGRESYRKVFSHFFVPVACPSPSPALLIRSAAYRDSLYLERMGNEQSQIHRELYLECPDCRNEMRRSHQPSQNCPLCRDDFNPRSNVSHDFIPFRNTRLCHAHDLMEHELRRRQEEPEAASRTRPELSARERPLLDRTIPGMHSPPSTLGLHRSSLSSPPNLAPSQAYPHRPHPITNNPRLTSTSKNNTLLDQFNINRTEFNLRTVRENAPRHPATLPRNQRDARSSDRPQTGERLRESTGNHTSPPLRASSETTRRLHTGPERYPIHGAQSTISSQTSSFAPSASSQPSRDYSQRSTASSAVSTVSTSSYASSASQRSYASDTTIRPPPRRPR